MAKQTYSKEERKAQFLKTGVALAKKDGLDKLTAAAVAAKCDVTAPLVFHIFGNRDKLRAAIKREAKKQGVTLAEPKAVKKAPAAKRNPSAPASAKKAPAAKRSHAVAKAPRKRSIAEVKAIKDKAAGKRKVSRSAKDGKFVDKATVEANPDTTVTQKVRAPRKKPAQKYPTQPVPATVVTDGEPKATI